MDPDELLHTHAEHRHGLVVPHRLRAEGVDQEIIRYRVEQGRLEVLSDRVLRVAGSPRTGHQRVLAAVLDAGEGAALARGSALSLWGLPGFRDDPVHVVRPLARNGLQPTLGVEHVTRDLQAHHVIELHGIPVCTVARALVDVAGEIHPERLARVCDQALARRLQPLGGLHRTVGELVGRGRAGSSALRAMLLARPVGYRPPESNLEARFQKVLADGCEPPLDRQVWVGDDDDRIGRVDFADLDLRIIFEVQSELFHAAVTARAADELRAGRLRSAGWQVEEILEWDIWHRPTEVVAHVRGSRAGALLRQRLVTTGPRALSPN